MRKEIVAFVLAAGAGLPAVAECPGPEHAAGAGVIVSFDDGSISHLRLLADGIVEDLTWYEVPGGDGYLVLALNGLYTLDDVGLENGKPDETSREIQTFADPLKSLPKPAPRLVWSGDVSVVIGTDPAFQREVSVAVGVPEQVSYGDCRYESLPAALRHRDEAADFVIRFDYLPAMGITVVRALGDHGGPEDSFTPVAIRAAVPGQEARP